MRVAVTGYVSEQAGSVASANAILLRQLLAFGHEIDFFSKPSFVDPRPAVGAHPGFRFIPAINHGPDAFRRVTGRWGAFGLLAGHWDAFTYHHAILHEMRRCHTQKSYDLCLWLGEYARGRVSSVPSVSFAQGPPGTDARSILRRMEEIRRLAGAKYAAQWKVMAKIRLSRLGLPPFHCTDHFIVGSTQSSRTLGNLYHIPSGRCSQLPYPIDLNHFAPAAISPTAPQSLRLLWVGRIIPRKRLDLFLDAGRLALDRGLDVRLTIVGGIGFVPGYEKLITSFARPSALRWEKSIPRADIPRLMQEHDVLVQPSEEENFGSSVAEAQACGLPVIIGHTNGNADYLCARDLWLSEDSAPALADACAEMARRKASGQFGDPAVSRQCAEDHFQQETTGRQLSQILEGARAKS